MAAQPHYTYLDSIIPQMSSSGIIPFGSETQKFVTAVIMAFAFLLIGRLVVSRKVALSASEEGAVNLQEGNQRGSAVADTAVIPNKFPSLFGIADFFMESFIKYHDSVAGVENRKHVPFTACVFFFIFALNLLGLIPGMPAATTTVWVNVAMAVVVFVYFNYCGIKEHGFVNYMKHFMGPIWWIAPLLFVIEMISIVMRVLTLNLRLYWNIFADHKVLEIFSGLLSGGYVLAAPFYFIGLFVSFMQAFVFATLTMIYIVLATQHDEEEGHH